MSKLDQSVAVHLRTIEASCPRLLTALHMSPEAVWGEIQTMELACRAYKETGLSRGRSEAAAKLLALVSGLRGQLARQVSMDDEDFPAFQQHVAAIQTCAHQLTSED